MEILGTVFKTLKGKCYFYDAVTNRIFETSNFFLNNFNSVVKEYKINNEMTFPLDIDKYQYSSEVAAFKREIEKGLIGKNQLREVRYPFKVDDYIKDLNTSLQHMILGITEECNLRCEYCTYSGHYQYARKHSTKKMSYETAVEAIHFLKEHSTNSESVAISFYGGEPLLCFDDLVRIVEYAEKQFISKPHHYQITTNGTMLNEEFINWFMKTSNVYLNITLNGDSNIHDKYRHYNDGKGTHHYILNNINRLIQRGYAEYQYRVNFLCNYVNSIDLESILNFYEDNKILKGKIPLLINQVNQIDQDGFLNKYGCLDEENDLKYTLLNKYISELVANNQNTFLKTYFDKRIYNIYMREMSTLSQYTHYFGVCTPFLTRVFVDSDGFFQICEKINMKSSFGNVYDGFNTESILEMLEAYKKHNTDCCNCWAIRMCPSCFYNTFTFEGVKLERRANICSSIRKGLLDNLILYCEIMDIDESLLKHLQNYKFPDIK